MKSGLALVAITSAIVIAGCGGSDGSLKVSAATSLKAPITEVAGKGSTKLEFAGSDAIGMAIRSGRRPDVFLAASLQIPRSLAAENLVSQPVVFARNRVVIAVRKGNTNVKSLSDLGAAGTTIALGTPSVPIGSYAEKVLAKLPTALRQSILSNVKTREPDASSVSAKVQSGVVDAAILYSTDVKASNGRLVAVSIPIALGSITSCAAVVVNGTSNEPAARDFIAKLFTPASQGRLVAAGFLPANR